MYIKKCLILILNKYIESQTTEKLHSKAFIFNSTQFNIEIDGNRLNE